MGRLRIIHLEDDRLDAELVANRLAADGMDADLVPADDEASFRRALADPQVRLILADVRLPGFDGLEALGIARRQRPDLPFLFVSGSIGEERAIETLRRGATDYVLKDRLDRLGPSVRRALEEAREHQERLRAEADLRQLNATLEHRVAERTAELQEYRDRLRSLAGEVAAAGERERRRISDVLHEDLAQSLAGARMELEIVARADLATAPREALQSARRILEAAIRRSRTLMEDVSPPVLYDQGLAPALEGLARLLERERGLRVEFDCPGEPALPDSLRSVLYQGIRELLANVERHAGIDRAQVILRELPGRIEAVVQDDGRGFDPAMLRPPSDGGGFGLFHVRERMALLGGSMEVESAPGAGTRVRLSLPRPGSVAGDLTPGGC